MSTFLPSLAGTKRKSAAYHGSAIKRAKFVLPKTTPTKKSADRKAREASRRQHATAKAALEIVAEEEDTSASSAGTRRKCAADSVFCAKRVKIEEAKVGAKKGIDRRVREAARRQHATAKTALEIGGEDGQVLEVVDGGGEDVLDAPVLSKKALGKRKLEFLDEACEDYVDTAVSTEAQVKKKQAYEKRDIAEPSSAISATCLAADKTAGSLPPSTSGFTIPLPPLVTPWPFEFPQATGSYSVDTACPIDWITYPELTDEVIRCYTNREPWNPKPKSWGFVARQEPESEDSEKVLSDEGMRKRFKLANQAIFNATGVYFLLSGIGLDDHGVPTDIKMKMLLREHDMGAEKKIAAGPSAADSAAPVTQPSKIVKFRYNMFNDEELLFDGPVTGIVLTEGQNTRATRYMSKAIRDNCLRLDDHILGFSPTAFDLWYTSICFGHRNTLPKRVYKLRKIFGGYTHQDEGLPIMTMATIMETYCLSQKMGTMSVSDMILDHIHAILKQDQELVAKFRDGKNWERTDGDAIRFLDLGPKDITKIWNTTQQQDPIRTLIHDIITYYPGANPTATNPPPTTASLASSQYTCFTHRTTQNTILSSFSSTKNSHFCNTYHTHTGITSCYRQTPQSTLSTTLIDNTMTPEDSTRKVLHGGIAMSIIDQTYNSQADFSALHVLYPHWHWERVKAVRTRILVPPSGAKVQVLKPEYFDLRVMDGLRRFPSHPGYQVVDWRPWDQGDGQDGEGVN